MDIPISMGNNFITESPTIYGLFWTIGLNFIKETKSSD